MSLLPENMRRWAVKQAKNHYWRVASYCGIDDLMQDAALHYHRVSERYQNVTDAHRNALFKVTFINHIHDLSKTVSKGKFVSIADFIREPHHYESDAWDALLGAEPEQVTFLAGLLEMPKACRDALKLIISPEGAALLRKVYRVRADGSRETLDERLHRLVKADGFVGNIPRIIRDHLLKLSDRRR